jgi:hypothetical protein
MSCGSLVETPLPYSGHAEADELEQRCVVADADGGGLGGGLGARPKVSLRIIPHASIPRSPGIMQAVQMRCAPAALRPLTAARRAPVLAAARLRGPLRVSAAAPADDKQRTRFPHNLLKPQPTEEETASIVKARPAPSAQHRSSLMKQAFPR